MSAQAAIRGNAGNMRKAARLLMAAGVILLVHGCATDYPVALQPDYATGLARENALSKVSPPLRFTKGMFTDKRSDPTVLVRFTERVHTHTLRAKRPLDETLFEGLGNMLKNSGHSWADSQPGGVRVDVELLEIRSGGSAGLPGLGTEQITASAASTVQARLNFVDARGGGLVYSQAYSATSERGAGSEFMGLLDKVTASVGAAMVVLVNRVGNDGELAAALGRVNR